MYAVINDKGKQHKVSVGEEILVDLKRAAEGDTLEFDSVLMIGDREDAQPVVGQPQVEGARVVATVLGHEKGPKLTGMRYRASSGPVRVKLGHRQKYTRVRVQEIHPG